MSPGSVMSSSTTSQRQDRPPALGRSHARKARAACSGSPGSARHSSTPACANPATTADRVAAPIHTRTSRSPLSHAACAWSAASWVLPAPPMPVRIRQGAAAPATASARRWNHLARGGRTPTWWGHGAGSRGGSTSLPM
ncbi:hypothetical protein DN402_07740 [Streptomyces sp. SW4]|nr:hypothetical protein DN402_07740 [Streptomyces sp. SW4]